MMRQVALQSFINTEGRRTFIFLFARKTTMNDKLTYQLRK